MSMFPDTASFLANTEVVKFPAGSRVRKVGGTYQADGTIVGVAVTRSGAVRYVFEFDSPAGMLHIFNGDQLVAL